MSWCEKAAGEIAAKLVEKGFTVHRYDAHKTSSVYLKLDYGACWSIRVSDHRGYKHLRYRWNIGPWIEERREEAGGTGKYQRHFFPADDVDALVARICEHRRRLLLRIGEAEYRKRVEKGKHDKATAKTGFWSHPETREVVGE